jgi:hypothetical protein
MYLIKNKTIKNIVLAIDGHTQYLYPKGDKYNRDQVKVHSLNGQLKNAKKLKFIQITRIEK